MMEMIEVPKVCGICQFLNIEYFPYFCPKGNTKKEYNQIACYEFELEDDLKL